MILLDREHMARLNREFLGREEATDVLAFDLRGGTGPDTGEPETAAEIYICPEVAENVRGRYGTTLGEECVLYAVHGMLHLSGGDDHAPGPRRAMRRAEDRLLGELKQAYDLRDVFGR
ncbi:MAG: rRNA maturation RNase YbeY [Lentisphaeria bacterium]|nr:rRNA maturation RNase YbeY [Lentisphaeria bacterium]